MTVLIDVAQLTHELAGERPPRLLDVRWVLTKPDGREDHAAGHIPGAVYVDLDTDLAAHGEPEDGRHPLPTREAFEAAARRWGLQGGDAVVVYDHGPAFAAARAWWLLRHAGVDVRILDGGLEAWIAAGGAVEAGAVTPPPGAITLDWDRMPVVDADGAGTWPSHGTLLDARVGERYRGEVEPVDPAAGHIPGAINAPTAANVHPDGTFLHSDDLVVRFAAMGCWADSGAVAGRAAESGSDPNAPKVAVYCGSGVTAAHQIAALEIAGIPAALYPGSWSQWSNQAHRPVATGAEPGA
ncbi:sulfurtransferase [Demequina pelophila]|uniref:sulfurtransferase n=1 Tax=Demequina pelophila TaxID=1638984 RepID=UPI0007838C9D|nr:sulfurtransferase [Demequina pelophila]